MIYSVGVANSEEQPVEFDNSFDAICFAMDRLEELYGKGMIRIKTAIINGTEYEFLSHEMGDMRDQQSQLRGTLGELHRESSSRHRQCWSWCG